MANAQNHHQSPYHPDLLHLDDANYCQEIGDLDDIDNREDDNRESNANENLDMDDPIIDITSNLDNIGWG